MAKEMFLGGNHEQPRRRTLEGFTGAFSDIPGYVTPEANTTEYRAALKRLTQCAIEPAEDIRDIGDTQKFVKGLGNAFRTVIGRNHTLEERRNDKGEIVDRGFSVRGEVNGDTVYAFVGGGANREQVIIAGKHGLSEYNLTFPANEHLENDLATPPEARIIPVGKKAITFHPATFPDNPHVQEVYISTLKRGANDILQIAKPPVIVPSTIRSQFEK